MGTVLYADKNDKNRRKAIKFKVEQNLANNRQQIDILEYFITNKKGLIAWMKMDPRMVAEVHRRAAKAAIKNFRTTTYVPKIARDWKTKIDEILMEYKKQNKDFRYIVRNGNKDLTVLIKRVSKGNMLPYRNLHLDVLGGLSPLKTVTEEKKETEETEETGNGFQKQRQRSRTQSFTPKYVIFKNITSILDGFDYQQKRK